MERDVNRALVLMGSRRVGETVMLHQLIQHLLDTGTVPSHVLFASIDTPVYGSGLGLERLLDMYLEIHAIDRGTPLTVIFDEVQYLPKWEVHLKSLVDTYPSTKFIVSGSAAAALKLASLESGAGRSTDFLLPPLTFAEYLDFVSHDVAGLQALARFEDDGGTDGVSTPALPKIDVESLNARFIEYLNYGGYPEAVFSPEIQADSERYLRSDIIDEVLLRDLSTLYGSRTSRSRTGSSRRSPATPGRRWVSRSSRAHGFEIYLTNPSMRAALFGKIDPDGPATPALAETALFGQWLHSDTVRRLYHARWDKEEGGEVDMVRLDRPSLHPQRCIEVKWSDEAATSVLEEDAMMERAGPGDGNPGDGPG